MPALRTRVQSLTAALLALMFLVAPALSQDAEEVDSSVWQDVISGQIEAFRAGDAEGALVFAGQAFKDTYDDPVNFIRYIIEGGYGAIVASTAHRFDDYQVVSDGLVLQTLTITGPDGSPYQALYQMGEEEDGWRVWSVALRKAGGTPI